MLDLRAVGIREVPIVGRYNYTRAHRGLAPHAHAGAMEICYLAKGTQLYQVGRQDCVLRGGDVFVTWPDETHSTGEAPQEKGVLYWIQFFIPARPARFLNWTGDDARKLVNALTAIPHRHFGGEPVLARILDDVLQVATAGDQPLRTVMLHTRLADFLLRVLACSRQNPRSCVSPVINQLLRVMETQVEQPLNLSQLAERANLSVSRLKARFKSEVGIPPAEYIQRCQIAAAKRLLADQRHTVTDVAYRLGFESSQYFATVFKRYTGTTPAQWAERARII